MLSIKWIKKFWIWVVLIFILLFFMSLNQEKSGNWNPIERVVVEITAPFQKFYYNTINGLQNIWFKYFYLIDVREENIRLKEEIKSLKIENYQYQELLATYRRLQELLQFTETTDQTVVAAQVIGKDPSGLFETVMIDKGRNSGLSVNMPVVNADGIVGRLVSVSDNYSKVLLLIDQNSAVDCIMQRSRDKGIVKGFSAKTCIMDYVLKTSDIRVGDIVVTSGLGGVFPKGVPVGKIDEIQEPSDELFMDIKITPNVDFSKLEELLVILKEDPLAEQIIEKD